MLTLLTRSQRIAVAQKVNLASPSLLSVSTSGRHALSSTNHLIAQVSSFSSSATRSALVELFIDDKPIKIEQGSAVIQACEAAGVDIPRFCYHERLSVAGNCRMCLVELEKSPKPIASCAMPVMPGMRIKTNTPLVKKAREGVMEFLLANHPLDCPICDQGGECDLQDQSVRYGSDRSRFTEDTGKRAVEDKDFGPLVKTTMTRCIQCTRCVRFATDVAGADELGTSGRGNDMQIGMYIEKALESEMSGNIIDLCPVGALTSKPYAFVTRPWELKKTETIDVMDGIGSHVRVDSRGLEVLRVLPRLQEDINEEWISDKTRFACDGLKRQRLVSPMIKKGGEFVPCTWLEALSKIGHEMKKTTPDKMLGVAGAFADAESLVALKDLFNRKGSENLVTENQHVLVPGLNDIQSNYSLNCSIAGIEEADTILFIGTNPRLEAPILNTRVRKSFLYSGLEIGVIGPKAQLNYDYEHVGESLASLDKGKRDHPFFQRLASSKKPTIVVGSAVLERKDTPAILASINDLVKSLKTTADPTWNIYNVLQRTASSNAALDIGYSSKVDWKDKSFIYLLSADEIRPQDIPSSSFVVYQGHHGDVGANYADVILPGAAYTEKEATYVNTEGRAQLTRAAVPPPAGAREDWKIVRALSEFSGTGPLPYEDVHEVRERMKQVSPTLVSYEAFARRLPSFTGLGLGQFSKHASKLSSPLHYPIVDFYLTDSISRASPTMAKCSKQFTHQPDGEDGPLAQQALKSSASAAVLADGIEAKRLQILLNDFLRQVDRPDFLGELVVTSLDFGSIPPSIEIKDISDPMDEFYLPDDMLLPFEPLGSLAMERTISLGGHGSSSNLNPNPSASSSAIGASGHHPPLLIDKSPFLLSLPSSHPSYPSLSAVAAASTTTSTLAPNHPSSHPHNTHYPTPEQIAAMKRETDVQVDILLEYNGNLTLGIATELIINQPTPAFMAMPVSLTLRGFCFRGKAIIAYLGDRVNFCFEEPEPVLDGATRASILEDVIIESEIGDSGKQVLKNIGKIEKFIVDMIRKGLDEFLVFPNYHSLDLIHRYDNTDGDHIDHENERED